MSFEYKCLEESCDGCAARDYCEDASCDNCKYRIDCPVEWFSASGGFCENWDC